MPQGEFNLIDTIVSALGDRAGGDWVRLGPGDDCSLVEVTADCVVVSSIDTLVAGVHFPHEAPAELIGYRALMVALSDLAAMAALPRYALVALTLPEVDEPWVTQLAQGMAAAARSCDVSVCGGNLARGPLSITVSVHGEVKTHLAVLRSGARVGDQVWVSGSVGGAAACVRSQAFEVTEVLTPVQEAYFKPKARFDLIPSLAGSVTAALDVSDGLVADAGHIARASKVALHIDSNLVPVHAQAELEDALFGGDDYQLLVTATPDRDLSHADFTRIGMVTSGPVGVLVDGHLPEHTGYDHFGSV